MTWASLDLVLATLPHTLPLLLGVDTDLTLLIGHATLLGLGTLCSSLLSSLLVLNLDINEFLIQLWLGQRIGPDVALLVLGEATCLVVAIIGSDHAHKDTFSMDIVREAGPDGLHVFGKQRDFGDSREQCRAQLLGTRHEVDRKCSGISVDESKEVDLVDFGRDEWSDWKWHLNGTILGHPEEEDVECFLGWVYLDIELEMHGLDLAACGSVER